MREKFCNRCKEFVQKKHDCKKFKPPAEVMYLSGEGQVELVRKKQ